MKMNMKDIMQPSKGTPNEGLSHKTGKTGVAVLKSAMCNKENVDFNGPPRQAVGALLSAVQASLVDLKHEVAAAKTLSDTATTVLQSSKNKPQDQHSISTPDKLEGHNQQLCTWLVMGVRSSETAITF
ncbi:hypothetical protein WJX75_007592 [Coccomyxa subellipsoidea]|uniref:Uncharacterized protein n=1 Tax=Coccomyxa subellipsoidea TaxID=248742 RepID=A0ABR2YJP7_9CHLO